MPTITHPITLDKIQAILPTNFVIWNEFELEFTQEQFNKILDNVCNFLSHYSMYGFNKPYENSYPKISKNIKMDFGLCHIPYNGGKHYIYINYSE